MANCIVHNDKFKDLVEKSGLTSLKLEALMDIWMTENNTEVWPTLEQLGISTEVSEETVEQISDTERIDEVYMPAFSEASEVPSEFNIDDFDIEESGYDFNIDETILAGEKQEGNIFYANLTTALVWQRRKVLDEAASIASLWGGKHGQELKDLKAKHGQKHAELIAKASLLAEKIEESKKMSNLLQIVDFGNRAIEEVTKILADSNLTVKGLNYARDVVDFWIAAGSLEDRLHGHIIFGDTYYKGIPKEVKDLLVEIHNKMADIRRDVVIPNDKHLVLKEVRKQLGNKYTNEEIYAPMKDIGFGKKHMFSLADYNSDLASAIYKAMARVDYDSAQETDRLMEEFDSKLKAADKFLGKGKDKYLMFYQEHNGQLTGDLVKIYSKKYEETKDALIKKARKSNKPEDWKAFKDWSRLNEDYVDIRLLFPERELSPELKALADEHKAKLLKSLSQKQFDRIMYQINDAIDMYNDQKMAVEKQLYSDTNLTETDIFNKLLEWQYQNSPYIELDRRLGMYNSDGTKSDFEARVGNGIVYANKGIKGIRSVAKAEYADGTKTEWYDKKYAEIAKNEETLDLYNYIFDTMEYMRSILPEYQRNHIGSNTMPFIEKSIMQIFTENGASGMAKLWNSLEKSVKVSDLNETEFDELDINTNKKKSKVQIHSMIRTNNQLQSKVDLKAIEYEASTGKKVTKKDLERFKDEVVAEENKNRSFDLPQVLKAYMATMISHKHKLNMADIIDVARLKFEDISEISVSNSGVEQMTPDGQVKLETGLRDIKEVLDYTINNFKNQQIHVDSGKFKEKSYTSEEKAEMQKLLHTQSLLDIQLQSGKIEKDSYDSRSKKIKDAMDKLGGYKMLSKYGDNLLKYNQMKGMGFNVIAGGVNLTTGWLENSIRAADERFFNTTQLGQSYRDVWSTIYDLKRSNSTTKKLISIEQRFRVVSDPSQELYRQEGKASDVIYIITKKTEFVNCMAFTGAFMRNIPVTDNKGQKSNLYEAFDDNGKIKEGWILDESMNNDDFLFNVEMQLRLLIKKSHGNYRDPLMGKKTTLGRMAFQFRTWMPEMYESRWGKGTDGKLDPILKKEFKGRWRSFRTLGNTEFNGNAFSAADNILYTTGQLLKKIAFMRTSFDGRMSEVDAANMKANLMELHFILGTIMLMMILKAAIPDEDKKKNFAYNMFINLILRQQNDIMVFANPLTFEQINKNVLPVFSVLSDTKDLVKAVKNEFSDDDRKTGRSLEKIVKAIPGAGQAVRIAKYGAKEMVQQ